MAQIPKQRYKLILAAYDDMWMVLTPPSIGEIMRMSRLIQLRGIKVENISQADLEALESPQRIFAKHLCEWNFTDNDVPVPATLDGVSSLPIDFFKYLLQEWVENTTEVKPASPLGSRSTNGLPFPGQQIPMEIPSLSLPS